MVRWKGFERESEMQPNPPHTPHLVHIGYHKTATTWFQRVLFPCVRNVRLVPRETAVAAFIEPGALQFDPALTRSWIGADRGERLILSLESLSGYPHNCGLAGAMSKDMAQRLRLTLPGADIVVFIRRQPEALLASYAQYVYAGGTHSLRHYLWPERYRSPKHDRRDRFPRFSLDHFDYLPLLRYYRELFGPGRVHVFLYEAFRADPTAFLEAFCARFALACDQPPATAARHNPSYPPWLLAVARCSNLFTAGRVVDKFHLLHVPGWFEVSRWLWRRLARIFPGRRGSARPECRFDASDLAAIHARYAASNRRLAIEFGLPLERYGYPLAPAQPGAAHAAVPEPAMSDSAPTP